MKLSFFDSPVHSTYKARVCDCDKFFKSLQDLDLSLFHASLPFLSHLRDLVCSGAFSTGDAYQAYLEFVRLTPGLYYGYVIYFIHLRDRFGVPLSDHVKPLNYKQLWLESPNTTKFPLVELDFSD